MIKRVVGLAALALAATTTTVIAGPPGKDEEPALRGVGGVAQQRRMKKESHSQGRPAPNGRQRGGPPPQQQQQQRSRQGPPPGSENTVQIPVQDGVKHLQDREQGQIARDGPALPQKTGRARGNAGYNEENAHQFQFGGQPNQFIREDPNANGRPPVMDTARHAPSDDWYDDFFIYFDDDVYTGTGKRGSYFQDDWFRDGGSGEKDYGYWHPDKYSHDGRGKGGKSSKSSKSSKKGKGKRGSSSKGRSSSSTRGWSSSSSRGRSSSSSSGKGKGHGGGKKGGSGGIPDGQRPTIPFFARAASPPALLAASRDGNSLSLGTIYPFGNSTFNADDLTSEEIRAFVANELVFAFVRLDGYCTRTGTPANTVEGYCHFTYTVSDGPGGIGLPLGEFVVEGPLNNPNLMSNNPCSALGVTGGTGLFVGASGVVEFCPAVINPDMGFITSLPTGQGLDVFDDAEAYEHIVDLLLDVEFVLAA